MNKELIKKFHMHANMCRDMKQSAHLWVEAADALEAADKRIAALEGAGQKMIDEYEAADDFHSAACMNWTACEVSTHQCGSCDMREALKEQVEGEQSCG